MIVAVELDFAAAAHLRRALEAHARWCREQGYPLPDALRQLSALATGGQERPKDAPVIELPEAAPMLVDYVIAAERLGVSVRTVRRLVAAGELRAVAIGAARRIHVEDLDDYTHRLRTGGMT